MLEIAGLLHPYMHNGKLSIRQISVYLPQWMDLKPGCPRSHSGSRCKCSHHRRKDICY